MMSTAEELALLAANRTNAYSFLSRALAVEVDEGFWGITEQMGAAASGDARSGSACDEDGLERGYRLVAGYVAGAPDDPLTDLAVDFAALFLGMGPTSEGAFPFESVYTSEDGLVMQEARDEMMAVLHAEGVAPAVGGAAEDHAATELAFLAHLAGKAGVAWSAGDVGEGAAREAAYAAFLAAHPLHWMPAFCDDVERLAGTDFYRGVACMTRSLLRLDAACAAGT